MSVSRLSLVEPVTRKLSLGRTLLWTLSMTSFQVRVARSPRSANSSSWVCDAALDRATTIDVTNRLSPPSNAAPSSIHLAIVSISLSSSFPEGGMISTPSPRKRLMIWLSPDFFASIGVPPSPPRRISRKLAILKFPRGRSVMWQRAQFSSRIGATCSPKETVSLPVGRLTVAFRLG